MEYISSWTEFELTLVVIGDDYTGTCKSNLLPYEHNTAAPLFIGVKSLVLYTDI
jgi:hypothetical protein